LLLPPQAAIGMLIASALSARTTEVFYGIRREL